MSQTEQIACVECDHPGCVAGLAIDSRHARNFVGRSWLCAEHEERH